MLGGGRQRVDTCSEHRLYCGRDLGAGERPRKAVAAAHTLEHGSTDQPAYNLLNEERIPVSALHQETL